MPKLLSEAKLLPADILLTSNDSFMGWGIRAFSRKASEDKKCRVNHAAICLGGLSLKVPEVVESKWRVKRTPLSDYDATPCIVWRCTFLTMNQRRDIAAKALERMGDKYAWAKLFLFIGDALTGSTWFTQRFGVTSRIVCSQLAAWAAEKALEHSLFGVPYRSVTPHQIDWNARLHAGEWRAVWNTLPTV